MSDKAEKREPENMLKANISAKGENSYYYAHSSSTSKTPAHAKIIEGGPGIISGGPPKKLSAKTADPAPIFACSQPKDEDLAQSLRMENEDLKRQIQASKTKTAQTMPCRVINIDKYGFFDDGPRVKLYIDVDKTVLVSRRTTVEKDVRTRNMSETGVFAKFTARSAEIHATVMCRDTFWAPTADSILHHRLVLDNLTFDVVPDKCSYKVNAEKGRIVVSLRKKDPDTVWTQVCSDNTSKKSKANASSDDEGTSSD